jgi:NTP pyrophosphatase (non-canonical NTP hydrolase)
MNIEQAMISCLKLREFEPAEAGVLTLKLGEEFGEFCEAVLKETGHLRHKTLKEGSFGEAADIINVILGVLQKLHPQMNNEQVLAELAAHVDLKRQKYQAILKDIHDNK